MIFHCTPAEGWQLREPQEFRAFKVLLTGLEPDEAPPLAGLTFEADPAGTVYAWIEPALPARLSEPLADGGWRAGFAKMVEFAAKHGWVREDGAVRAHVERAP